MRSIPKSQWFGITEYFVILISTKSGSVSEKTSFLTWQPISEEPLTSKIFSRKNTCISIQICSLRQDSCFPWAGNVVAHCMSFLICLTITIQSLKDYNKFPAHLLKGQKTTLGLLVSHSSDRVRSLLKAVTFEGDHSGTEKCVVLYADNIWLQKIFCLFLEAIDTENL